MGWISVENKVPTVCNPYYVIFRKTLGSQHHAMAFWTGNGIAHPQWWDYVSNAMGETDITKFITHWMEPWPFPEEQPAA